MGTWPPAAQSSCLLTQSNPAGSLRLPPPSPADSSPVLFSESCSWAILASPLDHSGKNVFPKVLTAVPRGPWGASAGTPLVSVRCLEALKK